MNAMALNNTDVLSYNFNDQMPQTGFTGLRSEASPGLGSGRGSHREAVFMLFLLLEAVPSLNKGPRIVKVLLKENKVG